MILNSFTERSQPLAGGARLYIAMAGTARLAEIHAKRSRNRWPRGVAERS